MQFKKHTLIKDHPDHHDAIRHLKIHDAHFVEVFDSYHKLESEIHNIEKDNSPLQDDDIKSFKKRRFYLRNEISEIIQKTERTFLAKSFLQDMRSLHLWET